MNPTPSSTRTSAAAGAVRTDKPQRPVLPSGWDTTPQHRVDQPHAAYSAAAAHEPLRAAHGDAAHTAAAAGHGGATNLSAGPSDQTKPADLLRLHAEDLIDRLQEWASDLDAREAQLNARLALQDHRERQFRLWSQWRQAETELALRDAQRLSDHLRAEARRIALTEPASPQSGR